MLERTVAVLITCTIGSSLLAFGAVYPWAYRPIFVACFVIGAITLLWCWRREARWKSLDGRLAVTLLLLVAAIAVQLLPVSRGSLLQISPAADRFLIGYDLEYAQAARLGADSYRHPLSISPQSTMLGLLFLVSLQVLFWSTNTLFSRCEPKQIARSVLVIGSIVAVFAIIQRATYNQKIYWLWKPENTPHPASGPFVNHNHFAGWLLMVIPLALGYFGGQLEAAMRGVKPDWRNRVLWFATSDASAMLLNAFCIGVMTLALFLTLSRSGMSCFLIATGVGGWFVIRRRYNTLRVATATSYVLLLIVIAVIGTGLDVILTRFAGLPKGDFHGRVLAWTDTLHIARDFPLVGTGFNTFGIASLTYQTTNLESHYAEAHSDYLQLLSEGGVLLAVPAVLIAVSFIGRVRARFSERLDDRMTYWMRVGAVTGIVAMAMQEAFEFSLQMPANAVMFTVLCGIAAHRLSADRTGREPGTGRAPIGGVE